MPCHIPQSELGGLSIPRLALASPPKKRTFQGATVDRGRSERERAQHRRQSVVVVYDTIQEDQQGELLERLERWWMWMIEGWRDERDGVVVVVGGCGRWVVVPTTRDGLARLKT
jgi:hypothetical protein